MIKFDDSKENVKEHNPNWPQIPNHPYKILIAGYSRSGKTNSFNLISQQPDIDQILLHTEDQVRQDIPSSLTIKCRFKAFE